MRWQYTLFFLMAAFPALMWIVGQIMETRLAKKGFPEEADEQKQSVSEKILLFITGVLAISSMIGLGIGAFNNSAFLIVGILSFISMIILMGKLGIIRTLLKG